MPKKIIIINIQNVILASMHIQLMATGYYPDITIPSVNLLNLARRKNESSTM